MADWFKGWANPKLEVHDVDDIVADILFRSAKAEARINAMTSDDHKAIFEGNALMQVMSKRLKAPKHG